MQMVKQNGKITFEPFFHFDNIQTKRFKYSASLLGGHKAHPYDKLANPLRKAIPLRRANPLCRVGVYPQP